MLGSDPQRSCCTLQRHAPQWRGDADGTLHAPSAGMGMLGKTLGMGLGLALCAGTGCDLGGEASGAEVRQAMDQVALTGQAAGLENGIVESTTSFTIGDGVDTILEEVRNFAQSQVACSSVDSPEPGTLVIDFGELDDLCQYRGKTYAGVVTVTWELRDDAVIVAHDYDAITDGVVTLDGLSTVTWSESSRRVHTDLAFENDAGSVEVESDRTQTLLGGLGEGIKVVGTRDWTSPRGQWSLDIDDVEMRAIDPVPQAGSYTLTTPQEHELTLGFERIDETTIEVSISGGRDEFAFRVTCAGDVAEE